MAEENPDIVEPSSEAENESQIPQKVSAEKTELEDTGSVKPSSVGDIAINVTEPQEEAPTNQDSVPENEATDILDEEEVPSTEDNPSQEDAPANQENTTETTAQGDEEKASTDQDGQEPSAEQDKDVTNEEAPTTQDDEEASTAQKPQEETPLTEDKGENPANEDKEETSVNEDKGETPASKDKDETPVDEATGETPSNLDKEEAPVNEETKANKDDRNEESPSHELGETRPVSTLEDIVEEEEVVDREELIATLREELAEQEKLRSLGTNLEHRIAEYLVTKKKTEERTAHGRSSTEQENRYVQCIEALEKLKTEMSQLHEYFTIEEEELKSIREEKFFLIKQAEAEFLEYQNNHALKAVHSRSGRRLTVQELDSHRTSEEAKEQQVIAVRLENIKLRNKITKLEGLIKKKEQLAEGLHMIDFEQLKINNVDLNEKIEERNDDILKLRRKVTSTVQVLTHVKEKLQFLQSESVEKRAKLAEMDAIVAKSRDHLTRMKQSRDSLRTDNNRLKQRGGLVGHKTLLRDYQEHKDENDGLGSRLELLQQKHSQLSVLCEGLRQKIEQAKVISSNHI